MIKDTSVLVIAGCIGLPISSNDSIEMNLNSPFLIFQFSEKFQRAVDNGKRS